MENWITPAIGIFIIAQASAAVWWASGTDSQVTNNTTAIEQVIENEKEIAIMRVQQTEIVKDMVTVMDDNKEVKELLHSLHRMVEDALEEQDGNEE